MARKKRDDDWVDCFTHRSVRIAALALLCCSLLVVVYLVFYLDVDGRSPKQRAHAEPAAVATEPSGQLDEPVLLVGIMSRPESRDRRDAVRQTWLKWARSVDELSTGRIRHVFLVGLKACRPSSDSDELLGADQASIFFDDVAADKPPVCGWAELAAERELAAEAAKFGDVLRVGVADSYTNLVYKMLALHRYAASQSDWRPQFVMKTDDDVFVRLDRIAFELLARGTSAARPLYWGFFWLQALRQTEQSAKNREADWQLDEYPPFASGVCTVVSWQLSSFVARSHASLRRFSNEDTSLGIWLAGVDKEQRHDVRMQAFDGICFDEMLTKHPMPPDAQRQMFANVQAGRDVCTGFEANVCPIGLPCRAGQEGWQLNLLCDAAGCRRRISDTVRLQLTDSVLDVVPAVGERLACGDSGQLQRAAVRQSGNLLHNPSFDCEACADNAGSSTPGWEGWHNGYAWTSGQCLQDRYDLPRRERGCLVMQQSDMSAKVRTMRTYGAMQSVRVGQTAAEPLLLSGWSRAEAVSGEPDVHYSLYMDVVFRDGSALWAYHLPFDTGSHDWQFRFAVWLPPKPVASALVIAMFRNHVGRVWFDDVRLSPLRDAVCPLLRVVGPLSRYGLVAPTPRQAVVAASEPAAAPTPAEPLWPAPDVQQQRFFLVWNRPAAELQLRHRRSVESVCRHFPQAHVYVASNTLPLHWPLEFWRAGRPNVLVVRYDYAALAAPFRPAHAPAVSAPFERALLPLLLLHRYGGTALAFDTWLLSPQLPAQPFVAAPLALPVPVMAFAQQSAWLTAVLTGLWAADLAPDNDRLLRLVADAPGATYLPPPDLHADLPADEALASLLYVQLTDADADAVLRLVDAYASLSPDDVSEPISIADTSAPPSTDTGRWSNLLRSLLRMVK